MSYALNETIFLLLCGLFTSCKIGVSLCFSVVAFRKANKLGVIFKVTPQLQDGDVKVSKQ